MPLLDEFIRRFSAERQLASVSHRKAMPRISVVPRRPKEGNALISRPERDRTFIGHRPAVAFFIVPLLNVGFAERMTLVASAQAFVPD